MKQGVHVDKYRGIVHSRKWENARNFIVTPKEQWGLIWDIHFNPNQVKLLLYLQIVYRKSFKIFQPCYFLRGLSAKALGN